MSEETRETMRDLVAGYSLGALSPEETRAFEAALAISLELQRDLQEHREVNALLALAEETVPPPDLKARLAHRIGELKESPLRPQPLSAPAEATARPSFTTVVMGAGLAAAALVAVGLSLKVGALTEAVSTRDSVLAAAQQHLAEREATLNAILEPTTQLVTMVATGEKPPIAQVFFDPRKRTVIVHAFNLTPASPGRAYQLWLLPKQGNPIPSRVFNTEASGHGLEQSIMVPPNADIGGFALTVEPAGGSPQPTSAIVLSGGLPAAK